MNNSYLSYNPNDYFWVSVKDTFDFSVCDNLEKPSKPTPSGMLNLVTGKVATDVSCSCPTCPTLDPSCNITTPPANEQTTTPPFYYDTTNSGSTFFYDEFTQELCKNKKKSMQLHDMQILTSAGQNNYYDSNNIYLKTLRKIVNVSIGIIGISIAIAYT